MEMVETKLFEAASKGSVDLLQKLLKEDPLILDRGFVNCFSETPLHVAALLGHIEFAKEIIKIKPQLTTELNSLQSSPLHLASAKGHVEIVRALLSVNPRTCLARDRNSLTPLHLAAQKGHVEVMTELLQAEPDAARLTLYGGENILHLCVKHYQLEALKLLVNTISEPEFVNAKDNHGNTVLHLAVADQQVETINFLLTVAAIEVNAPNHNEMTPGDTLIQTRRDVRDLEIQESLKRVGGFGIQNVALSTCPDQKNSREMILKQKHNWLEEQRSPLMVVASLIATMAFQVGVNPPSGVWQQDTKTADDHLIAGFSIMAHNYPSAYRRFYRFNTTSFIASLSIIFLLMSGLPIRSRVFMWVLMVVTWLAITTIALVYSYTILVLTPSEEGKSIELIVGTSIFVWLCLMALLLVGHTIRLVLKMVRKLRKRILGRRRRMVPNSPILLNNAHV